LFVVAVAAERSMSFGEATATLDAACSTAQNG
jgi:hypothetical protein